MSLLQLDLIRELNWILIDENSHNFEYLKALLYALFFVYDSLVTFFAFIILVLTWSCFRFKQSLSFRDHLRDSWLAYIFIQNDFLGRYNRLRSAKATHHLMLTVLASSHIVTVPIWMLAIIEEILFLATSMICQTLVKFLEELIFSREDW